MHLQHRERHKSGRAAWLRAAVLGANDGILSTAALLAGVSVTGADRGQLLLVGIAALSAGAFSMAAGEYASVSSQRDAELADLAKETRELEEEPEDEQRELAAIYRERGLSKQLAAQVAAEFSANDPLKHHLRDELGFSLDDLSRPTLAAVVSASAFGLGALLPLLVASISPTDHRGLVISIFSVVGLALLGAVGARLGGASPFKGAFRIASLGALAMAITTVIGNIADTSLG